MIDLNQKIGDLYVLCRGPLSIIKVEEQESWYKYHFSGAIEFGDEYHTMHELYQHRRALNIALFNMINVYKKYPGGPIVMKSKLHHDGTMFEGYFVVILIDPNVGQISYHYLLKHWDEFLIPEIDKIPFPYDGHTSKDTIERLMKL